MTHAPKPILLTWQMPQPMYVTSFRTINSQKKSAFEHSKEFPLPSALERANDYDPPRMHLLSREPLNRSQQGWSCDGQWEWKDSPVRAKSRIFQQLIRSHFRKRNRNKLGNQWIINGPVDVKSSDGIDSSIWICADFQYIDIEGNDGIAVEISRKVQASNSIWEEMNDGIYGLNSEIKQVRVKVRDASNHNSMRSMNLVEITEWDLNAKAWADSDLSVAEYWNQSTERYTVEDANTIPVVLVNRFQGDKSSRYPADQVYRIMSMDNWPPEVRKHLVKYLNLTPTDYLNLVKIGMGWLRGWEIADNNPNITFGWNEEIQVNFSDSRNLLFLPDGSKLLDERWRWFNHLKEFEELHHRPPPSIDAHYIVPSGFENHYENLKKHADVIFQQVPEWNSRIIHHDLKTLFFKSEAEVDLKLQEFIEGIESKNRSVVVFTALPPKKETLDVDLYRIMKYTFDEAGVVHQNFAVQSRNNLKKLPDQPSGKVNVLQMLLKHGFLPVPYICSTGNIDVVCALDVGRIGPNESVTAFAISLTKSGQLWGTTPKGEPQTGETISEDAIRRTIKGILRRHQSINNSLPSRILIMRDGNTPQRELNRLKQIVEEYREIGVDICWISVRKSGTPRLLLFNENQVVDELPLKGHWMKYGERSGWLWTTGKPELKEGRPGIPQGSSFTIEVNFEDNPLNVEDVASLLIAHAHASQMQPWNSTRLPFVHHLADKMAKAMANGQIPLDQKGTRFSAA